MLTGPGQPARYGHMATEHSRRQKPNEASNASSAQTRCSSWCRFFATSVKLESLFVTSSEKPWKGSRTWHGFKTALIKGLPQCAHLHSLTLVIPCISLSPLWSLVLSLSLSLFYHSPFDAIRCHSPLHERVPSSSIEFLMISQAAPHHVWWSFRRSGFIDEPAPVTHRMRRDGNGCMKLATHQIISNYNASGYRYKISKRRASAQKQRWQWGSKSAWWRWRHRQRSSQNDPKCG